MKGKDKLYCLNRFNKFSKNDFEQKGCNRWRLKRLDYLMSFYFFKLNDNVFCYVLFLNVYNILFIVVKKI